MQSQVCSCLLLLGCYLLSLEMCKAQTYNGMTRGGYTRYFSPRKSKYRYDRYYRDTDADEAAPATYTNVGNYRRNTRACTATCPNKYKPVCGSDLRTYRNGCEFKKHKCINNEAKFIYLKESCPPYVTQCHLTHYCESGRRVCGTDGVTYSSVCQLTTTKCNTGVTVASKGPCGTFQNIRKNGRPRVYTNPRPLPNIGSESDEEDDRVILESVAVINTDLDLVRPRATSIPRVTRIYVPPPTEVMGRIRPRPRPRPRPAPRPGPAPRPIPQPTQSPYNIPMLTERSRRGRITRVTMRPSINRPVISRPTVVRPPTSAPRVDPRPTVVYPPPTVVYPRPTVVYPRPTDVNPRPTAPLTDAPCDETCSLEYEPVCGTDDVTYPSACVLRAVACQKGIDLTVWYGGSCIVSTTPPPPIYTTSPPGPGPRQDPSSDVQCVEGCPIEYSPVCGLDGVTYPSPCIIESMACLYKNPFLQIDYEGECKIDPTDTMVGRLRVKDNPCEDMRCDSDAYKPVCGSDKKIYDSLCQLDKRACRLRDNTLVDVEVRECVPKVKLHIENYKYVVKLA